jgi:hypothetical protein
VCAGGDGYDPASPSDFGGRRVEPVRSANLFEEVAMGAWGVSTFDNDAAGDWAVELAGSEDLSFVAETLDRALEAGEDYLDADDACMGLAACELIARLGGHWGTRGPETEAVDSWVEAHPLEPGADLVEKAARHIDRVLMPGSELMDLWEEGKDPEGWRAAVEDLRARVSASR